MREVSLSMPLSGLSLTHYTEPGRVPFRSITALTKNEAMQLARKLAPSAKSRKNRFCAEDFPGYYHERVETEQWLYSTFLEKGYIPETSHPLYFVLGSSEYLHEWFGKGDVYALPLASVGQNCISFTVGDSMSVVRRPDRRLLTLGELEQAAVEAGGIDALRQNAQVHYIEAQLWLSNPPPGLRKL